MNLYLKFFSCLEVYVVLLLINPYIRSPINHYILVSNHCNIIYTLILLITINSLLSYLIYRLFTLFRETFYANIFEIIEYVTENYYIELSLIQYFFGYVFYVGLEDRIMTSRRAVRYGKRAKYLIRQAEKHRKLSKVFNSVSPLLDRSGNGGLYDSFTEWNRDNKLSAEILQENALFFWRQAHYLGQYADLSIRRYSPLRSPILTALTGL